MPPLVVDVSGDMTLTRSMPSSSIFAAISSVMSSPEPTRTSEGLIGLWTSSLEKRPMMRSFRPTISSSPSKIAFFQTPSRAPQSSSAMITSIATSQSLRVR
jgi:hypothetical protein